ncbi:propionyl-CoA carboxylase subunit alpha [Thecamonas trahens ATCC 50062]|uniref:Propionyl-CoA carboxylase alpha chain, mitochondrial n=1 Tax=Thecamonas trahens ATCC 50062 TaxID=461836 RepID=A0A0L0DBM3_THETB|nr:propionyl-CoA carboxylase subunit alpha [Thecamonas trahens ATCC 50062]KNC48698.1 propionyl-CoA carboxylase subunit alpha [Thecamonas trahens ATCC 50062]|eukprot:XP_013762754.1 propionyl-CoA carboxylase subunit alpha [Thecamonas trahens ATCC 50062]
MLSRTWLTTRTATAAARYASSAASKPFDKILVANRGEIACRVFASAKKLGMKTVAVYSEADAHAKHTKMADEAVCVGPAASADSYLVIDNILEAVRMTGAQAVHPGYGFLSENAAFSQALEDEGVAFVGPPPGAITSMGYKIESKRIAQEAGVSTVPGFAGVVGSAEEAVKIAADIGFPVMVKADAGGGGKGMRVAWNESEVAEAFRASTEEAAGAFNNADLLVEKFIHESPRHIEIQLIADKHGNAVYLNERECSLQRRNQKVVEEAPSVVLTPEVRRAMGEQAVALAKAVDYSSAGTVEFLVDANLDFYFLEMNTRLQVEHPVTELITGVDLVEEMFRVAAGEKLSITQDEVKINGWSFESRVYAENPYRDFLPSTGRLTKYVEPGADDPNVRCDSGILPGSEISIYYDPLICKLVTHGPTREAAANTMKRALDEYVIRGVGHNVPFLREVFENDEFNAGNLTTNFIPEHFPDGFHGHQLSPREKHELLASAVAVHHSKLVRAASIDVADQVSSFERPDGGDFVVTIDGEEFHAGIIQGSDDAPAVVVLGEAGFDLNALSDDELAAGAADGSLPVTTYLFDYDYTHGTDLLRGSLSSTAEALADDADASADDFADDVDSEVIVQVVGSDAETYQLQHVGTVYDVKIETPRVHELRQYLPAKPKPDLSKFVLCPMPGQVINVLVQPGEKVAAGQPVAVIEAMKMQNQLLAETDGVVKAINYDEGASVAADDLLIEFE